MSTSNPERSSRLFYLAPTHCNLFSPRRHCIQYIRNLCLRAEYSLLKRLSPPSISTPLSSVHQQATGNQTVPVLFPHSLHLPHTPIIRHLTFTLTLIALLQWPRLSPSNGDARSGQTAPVPKPATAVVVTAAVVVTSPWKM